MSSRLNPRDYDLGELRDAVRETSRSPDGGRSGAGRDDGRTGSRRGDGLADGSADDGLDGDRRDESSTEPVRTGDQSRNGGGSDGPRRARAADSRVADNRGAAGQPVDERAAESPDDESRAVDERSVDGGSERRASAGGSPGDRQSVGGTRRNTGRFARSTSRDRTAGGAPRRRRSSGGAGDSRRRSAGSAGRSGPWRRHAGTDAGGFELLRHSQEGDLERPYLARLPDGYAAQTEIFDWLEGLLATSGRETTLEALAYYESVGWLSGDSRESLEDFLEGLSAVEPPDPRPLGVDDHRESLRYVARLARRAGR